jgi:hypothetical protein
MSAVERAVGAAVDPGVAGRPDPARTTCPKPATSKNSDFVRRLRGQRKIKVIHRVWLWVTNHHMREAFDVLASWGFRQKTILTWAKARMGTGDWLRGQTEHALMAVRGNPIVTLTNETTLLPGPVRAHSQKPEEFYALVERLCPAPRYAELFARTKRPRRRHLRRPRTGEGR